MGQKVNPRGLRIGITTNWKSRWFNKKEYAKQLREDVEIRRMVEKKLRSAAVGSVDIERSSGLVRSYHQNGKARSYYRKGRNRD